MHLVATNLALWVRLVVYESVNDLIRGVYGGLPPPASVSSSLLGGGAAAAAGGDVSVIRHSISQRDIEPRRLAFNGPSYDQTPAASTGVLITDLLSTGESMLAASGRVRILLGPII
jgi:hypothetical protein